MTLEEAKDRLQCVKKMNEDYLGEHFTDGFELTLKETNQAIDTVLKALEEYEKQLDLDYVDKNYVSKEYHEMVVKEQNYIINDYYALCEEIAQVTKDLGLPEDTIIADEMVEFIKEKYISKDKVKAVLEIIVNEKNTAMNKILTEDYRLAENGAVAQELGYIESKLQELLAAELIT